MKIRRTNLPGKFLPRGTLSAALLLLAAVSFSRAGNGRSEREAPVLTDAAHAAGNASNRGSTTRRFGSGIDASQRGPNTTLPPGNSSTIRTCGSTGIRPKRGPSCGSIHR